ncbi:MAG: metallo-mystery pair system four-Cys motif protein [Oleiphilaceae bacterium]|nr:metallo-mystery pair system four-Cys motif protein [Oleiphilaceae bacterium]
MKLSHFTAISTCALLAACSSGGSTNVNALQEQDVSIAFAAEANNVSIDCDTQLTGLGTNNTNADIREFRFYVHDIRLTDDQSNEYALDLEDNAWNHENVGLLDFMNKDTSCSGATKNTNTQVEGTVSAPANVAFTGITFSLGIPSELNHADRATAVAPLDQTSMHWNWQNGYKFARLDVAPVGGIIRPSDLGFSASSWNFHLGSTNCSGDPQLGETVTCARPNRPPIALTNFDPSSQQIVLNFDNLVSNSDLTQDLDGAPGCMSGATDPECASIFEALGLDVAIGSEHSSVTQTVFSVR